MHLYLQQGKFWLQQNTIDFKSSRRFDGTWDEKRKYYFRVGRLIAKPIPNLFILLKFTDQKIYATFVEKHFQGISQNFLLEIEEDRWFLIATYSVIPDVSELILGD